jgi:integral membrane protein (TIGR01906 family)
MQQSGKITWLCAVIFPFLMLLLIGNALVFDTTVYKNLLRPGAVNETMQLLDYFHGKAEVPSIFSKDEKAHLADVKQVIFQISDTCFVLFVIFLLLMLKADTPRVFTRGFGILIALIIMLAFVPFDSFFNWFHRLFFTGNWLFPANSMLILLYPETFFQVFFAYILSLTLAFSAVFAVYGYIVQKQKA